MTDLVLAQLHRALLDALRRSRPEELDRSVTVAEIYQDLVPYRSARAIGFELNADYEHALLRLLAGEGDLARIEPREVRDKLRLELESPNPDVGLYRNYAACDVWINVGEEELPSEAPESRDAAGWETEFVGPATRAAAPQPESSRAVQREPQHEEPAGQVESKPAENEPPPPHARSAFEMAAESARQQRPRQEVQADTCVVCGGELPEGRAVNFCPFCGADQSQQPCPTCGEMLEPLWRFCVACGTRVPSASDDVN